MQVTPQAAATRCSVHVQPGANCGCLLAAKDGATHDAARRLHVPARHCSMREYRAASLHQLAQAVAAAGRVSGQPVTPDHGVCTPTPRCLPCVVPQGPGQPTRQRGTHSPHAPTGTARPRRSPLCCPGTHWRSAACRRLPQHFAVHMCKGAVHDRHGQQTKQTVQVEHDVS
jgi:hypothetical protein